MRDGLAIFSIDASVNEILRYKNIATAVVTLYDSKGLPLDSQSENQSSTEFQTKGTDAAESLPDDCGKETSSESVRPESSEIEADPNRDASKTLIDTELQTEATNRKKPASAKMTAIPLE